MLYSTFTSINDAQAVTVDEGWPAFVARLSKSLPSANKGDAGLFCATNYKGSQRRNRLNADKCSMLVLDFDNCKKDVTPKARLEEPIQIDLVQAMLEDYEYVIATSFSHTEEWPRFRVILPLVDAVPVAEWESFATAAIRDLGFELFLDAIDKCYANPVQIYYWPAHPIGSTPIFIHNEAAEYFPVNISLAGPATSEEGKPTPSEGKSKFTKKQIAAYWGAVLPSLGQEADKREWKGACPLHKGTNPKFYVNSETGLWRCWSKCPEDKNAGDIYKFEMYRNSMDFKTAKDSVHEIIGGEPGAAMTATELEEAIIMAEEAELPRLMDEIAKQPPKRRSQLTDQLITTHQLKPEDVKNQIKQAAKVIQFSKRDEEAAAREASATEIAEKLSSREPDAYGLCMSPDRYEIGPQGVFVKKMVPGRDVVRYERLTPPLAERPIWPAALGLDGTTGRKFVKLAWTQHDGRYHDEWMPAEFTNDKAGLLKLDSAPVNLATVVGLSQYLDYAKNAVVTPAALVASDTGWVGSVDERRFILDGDPVYEYIGPPMGVHGTVEGWSEPLKDVLAMGTAGFNALATLGLSAASPLVRLTNKRNPVLGLVADSSTGKGTVIEWALAIWTLGRSLTLSAGSTLKGTQDATLKHPDLPICVDELQQTLKKDPKVVEELMYYMANGQRRTTSSRDQKAKGGERRYGACLFAAEHGVMATLQRGAQNRVIELQGDPVRDVQMAAEIQRASYRNYGVVGRKVAEALNNDVDGCLTEVERTALEIGARCEGLVGDDAYTISFVIHGLRLLSEVCGILLPYKAVGQWLIGRCSTARREAVDPFQDTFTHLLESIVSMAWNNGGTADATNDTDSAFIAWRKGQVTDVEKGPLEINPTAKRVIEIMRSKGQTDLAARTWAERGWLLKHGNNLKWQRRNKSKSGDGAMVWRVTPAGLALIGLDPNFEPLPEKEE